MFVLTLQIILLLVIAIVYALFDIFNNRNVPSIFAYGTLAIAVLATLTYAQSIMVESFAIAAVILGIGYVIYKIGQLGAADVIEFAAISMLLPIQVTPYLISSVQYNLPFIISVFIASGVTALVLIPLYYLPRARIILGRKLTQGIGNKDVLKGGFLVLAYAAFIIFLYYQLNVGIAAVVLILLIMLGSVVTAVFEKPITDSMVSYLDVGKFEEGDIIALNLMKESDVAATKKKIAGFDRLVTKKIIDRMKKEKIKQKFPVYRQAMPLALPILIGVIVSLLFGNVLLFLI